MGDQEAQHLSDVLHNNNVSIIIYSKLIVFFSFIQTLTTLNLSFNQVGKQGARYLSDILRNNQVEK